MREIGIRGVSQRTNAQTEDYLMGLTLEELVKKVTAINGELRTAPSEAA